MQGEREVAGMRCSEVLEDLSAYVDGDLDAARRAQIEAHLAGCNRCERFGGEFGTLVQSVRQHDAALPKGVAERLEAALKQAARTNEG